jgi:uncharacterized protein YciI
MLFALICTDKPNHLDVRQKAREAHLAYLATLSVKAAGPFTDDAGNPCGSLVIIDTHDRAAAEAIAAADPYAQAGLFASVEIRPWKWLIKNPETR